MFASEMETCLKLMFLLCVTSYDTKFLHVFRWGMRRISLFDLILKLSCVSVVKA